MNRMLIIAGVLAVAALALWRPAARPAQGGITSAHLPAANEYKHRRAHRVAPASAPAVVYVAGSVRHPGLYALPESARVDDAVRRAGGFLPEADAAAVNLAEHVVDGEEIRVVRVGEATPRPSRSRTHRRRRLPPAAAIDLNAADASALGSLPGIGPTLAARIVEYRELNGPFASLDELADVAGMTQRRIDAVIPYLTLHDGR